MGKMCSSALCPFLGCMSCAIYLSVCAVSAKHTLFDIILIAFLKKWSPPSVQSIIFKASCMQNLQKCTFFAPKLAMGDLPKTITASQNLKNHRGSDSFLFLSPVGKLGFPLYLLSPTIWMIFPHFHLASSVIF